VAALLCQSTAHAKKQVHYLSMEFLPAAASKSRFSLGLEKSFHEALDGLGVSLETSL
jgi:glucan phosphorylase